LIVARAMPRVAGLAPTPASATMPVPKEPGTLHVLSLPLGHPPGSLTEPKQRIDYLKKTGLVREP